MSPEPRLPDALHQEVHAAGGFAYGAIGADIHVFGDGMPVYLLHVHRPPNPAQDSTWLREPPSRMLGADAAVVEFTGRQEPLTALDDWCGGPPGLRVRWLHGAGGQGKTRLAHELAGLRGARGWLVVDAVHAADTEPPDAGSQDLRVSGGPGVLLLVDYADRWPLAHLNWLLTNALLEADVPVRVLLIARSADAWPALRAKLARRDRNGRPAATSDQLLHPLPTEGDDRAAMFRAARSGFARHYPALPDPDAIPPPLGLDHPDFGLTLSVHMAALVAVDARAHHRSAPDDLIGLTTYLLDREHENWAQRHENRAAEEGHGISTTTMARAVFTAVLTGPVRRERAGSLLPELLFTEPAETVLADHAACYPPSVPGDTHVLHPLLPDRLAEDFLALSLPGSPVTGHPIDLWTVTAVHTVLRRRAGQPPPYTPRALSFLTAAAERWPHIGDKVLFPLLRRDPELAVRAGSAVLTSLATMERLDPDVVRSIGLETLLKPTDDALIEGTADFTERAVEQLLSEAPDEVGEAALVAGLSFSRGRAGRTTDALTAAEEAVTRFRKLAAADPAYRTMLAAVLLQSGELLARVPRPAEAIARCEDSVRRYRTLAADDPALLPQLAAALAGLGDVLQRGGQLGRALAVTEEAEGVHASLREVDLLAFVKAAPQHAELTHQRALLLAEHGKHQEALAAAEHTVGNLRQLVPFDPKARTPRLATALITLGGRLRQVGRITEAAEVIEEAVGLYRPLAAARPQLRPELATAVHELGSLLAKARRTADAEPFLTEALEHHRRLAESDPAQWLPYVAKALHDLRALTARDKVAWGSRGEIDRLARQLRRRRDRSGLWELALAVPVGDAARITRRLPRRWKPQDPAAQPLATALRTTRSRSLTGAAQSLGQRAVVSTHDPIHSARQLSFAPTGPLLTLLTAPDAGAEHLHLLDTSTGRRTLLYEGPAGHGSFSTLPSGEVVAIRTPWSGRSRSRAVQAPAYGPWELVQYGAGRTERLGSGPLLDGARAVAIDAGYVIGLRSRSGALLGHPGAPLRRVSLEPFGLGRGDVVAADPTGTRLAFADGPLVVLTDSALTTALARGTAPPDHGNVEELVFVSSDELVSVGDRGSVFLWQVVDGRLLMVATAENAPRLRHLFAVPSWRTVGGWAPRERRAHCYDTATLTPRGLPRPSDRPPLAVAASSDGRRLAYATGGGLRRRSRGASLAVHDLLHPAAVWERPLAALSTAELEPSWGAVQSLPSEQRDLLLLTRAAVEYRSTPPHGRTSG
ncbi:hypothetical protein ACFQ61_34810 [Streptomyces sp. NPDC056500]|uniref:hypothetical protein n=1 Tax=Streptomyces sp. NPDC056500 TaxID=3345840 RepID=UPI00369A4230